MAPFNTPYNVIGNQKTQTLELERMVSAITEAMTPVWTRPYTARNQNKLKQLSNFTEHSQMTVLENFFFYSLLSLTFTEWRTVKRRIYR